MNPGNFLTGSRGGWSQRSTLGREQQNLYNQLQQAGIQGTFDPAANYYRGLLSDDNSTFNALAQPEIRRFNQQILPDIAEQFAGMGSGALSSSGFRNAAVNAGADLSERLAAMRANLRGQAAQGLTNIGQQGLGQYNQNVYTQGQPGLLDYLGQAAGSIAGMYANPYSIFDRLSKPGQTPTGQNPSSLYKQNSNEFNGW